MRGDTGNKSLLRERVGFNGRKILHQVFHLRGIPAVSNVIADGSDFLGKRDAGKKKGKDEVSHKGILILLLTVLSCIVEAFAKSPLFQELLFKLAKLLVEKIACLMDKTNDCVCRC